MGFFNGFFLSNIIVFTKSPSFLLKMDLDNLGSGVSGFICFSFQFPFLVQEETHSGIVMPH
jgi:hypothetical protein